MFRQLGVEGARHGLRQVSGWQGAKSLHAAEAGGGAVAYKGMVDCFARTVQEEGWRALFKVRLYPYILGHCCRLEPRDVHRALRSEMWSEDNMGWQRFGARPHMVFAA